MLISRWKLMTGVIGLSIGGFATFGGQTPPADSILTARAEPKIAVPPPPSVNPAPAPATATTTLPSAPPVYISGLNSKGVHEGLQPSGTFTPDLDVPIRAASSAIELPTLPLPESKPLNLKPPTQPTLPASVDTVVLPGNSVTLPLLPPTYPPANTAAAPTPPSLPPMPKLAALPQTDTAILPVVEYTKPAATTVPSNPPSLPPLAKPTVLTQPEPPAIPSKFRIVLRVGAGDPTFEVRLEDDLVMKVVCEKVDIKSPEKGQGPSNVVATGKVRFVGFGAEGTCDSFSFLAGTGEVALTGNVNVKVRDKIGRVESELNADKMQYKLDQTVLSGVLKP